ncbi:hypothetical protein [Sphingomonas sp. GC_Shp_2]|nr:hypothetical protein [Sphingomonas sp. GC_Shp_2]
MGFTNQLLRLSDRPALDRGPRRLDPPVQSRVENDEQSFDLIDQAAPVRLRSTHSAGEKMRQQVT